MTRKEQNKILDDKIESNINQYNVDRLYEEILYSLYRSKALTKTVYNNLIKSIGA